MPGDILRRHLAIAAIAALLLAACGGGNDDSASSSPVAGGSTPTTMAMGGAGGEHSEHGGTPPVDASCTPSGSTVSIVASGTKFNKTCLAAPAGEPFTLTYENKDSVVHNIVLLESHTATDVLFRAELVPGPKTATFNVGALKAGTFAFHCEVHPGAMTGTLVVK
jgi:plastocyanin